MALGGLLALLPARRPPALAARAEPLPATLGALEAPR